MISQKVLILLFLKVNYSPNQIEEFYNNKDYDKIAEIYQEQVAIKSKQNKLAKQEYEVGDKVRIFTAADNDLFPSRKWSLDVYTVEKVYKPKKEYSNYTYKLEGDTSIYQNHELLKVLGEQNKASVPERWEVSKIIKALTMNECEE